MRSQNLLFALAALAIPVIPAHAMPTSAMDVTSHDVRDGARLSNQQVYTDCNGDNVSPELVWSGAPAGTKSFAVTLFDPDSTPDGWWHWIVFDVPAKAQSLARGVGSAPSQLPIGSIEGENDFGANAYGGACPPQGSGLHHYQFTIWALDTAALPFDATVTGSAIGPYLAKHALGEARLTAVYQR
jgi:Raf kinase inhibitor-like YbhB/YbcL family protein